MTPKEAPAFFAALAKLSIMHRLTMDKPTARVYFEALLDVPLDLLVLAMQRLLRDAGEFMPTSGKIREICDEVQNEQHAREVAAVAHPQHMMLTGDVAEPRQPYFDCNVCLDIGTRKICPGCNDFESCTKHEGDYCAAYHEGRYRVPVGPCACAPTNPTILRRRKLATQPKPYSSKHHARRRGGFTREYEE